MTISNPAASDFHWGEHPFPQAALTAWIVGPLVLWGRGVNDEIWLTHIHRGDFHVKTYTPGGQLREQSPPIPDAPELTAKEWSRWVLKEQTPVIQFTPVFPDLPVVVKPEYPFRVTPNAKAHIYVRVPVWLRVSAADIDITEIPSVVLSQTWFGDPMSGELCYWISSSARRDAQADLNRPYQAICPILIVNASAEELIVEKICLRVPSLTMFLHEGQLWSDVTTVRYRGLESGSEIEPSGVAPDRVKGAEPICPPRAPISRSLVTRTFTSLMEFGGFGNLND